ncbi:hypothetical protein [Litoribacterium kuwaitense]|nr:hypothetical protein [Litoribacterium kuwaitense]
MNTYFQHVILAGEDQQEQTEGSLSYRLLVDALRFQRGQKGLGLL